MKRILAATVLSAAVAAGLAGATSYAQLTDTEASGANSVAAGTLDLGLGETASQVFNIPALKPGDTIPNLVVTLTNPGTLPGDGTYRLMVTTDLENGCSTAESAVDSSCAAGAEGELDSQLRVSVNGAAALPLKDLNNQPFALNLPGGGATTVTLGFTFDSPAATDASQSDSVAFRLEAQLTQS